MKIPVTIDLIDQLDFDHQKLAMERLHFLNFLAEKSPLMACKCHGGVPTPILAEGPPQEPGARRRIECGRCHKFYFWLPKLKNQNRRASSSTGLADSYGCQCCRKIGVNLIGHHVVEVQEGGTNSPENVWTVCEPCHQIIHALRRHALGPFESVGEAQRQPEDRL